MACFSAPAAVAVVTTLLRKKIPKKYHIEWLNTLLWGGTIGLALEHISHKEIVFYPPYLTAMKSAEDTAVMVHEIMTVGVAMVLVCLVVWAAMVFVANRVEEKAAEKTVQSA